MKSWIRLFVIGAAIIQVLGYNAEQVHNECLKESDITQQELASDMHVGSSDNRNVKCFYACTAKKIGWLTENGDIITDKLIRPMHEIPEEHRPMVEQLIQKCVKKGKDPCETGYFVTKCLQENLGPRRQG